LGIKESGGFYLWAYSKSPKLHREIHYRKAKKYEKIFRRKTL